jgi:hypothetical protein
VTENDAQLSDYKDPSSGLPLQKMTEESYFFRMSAYQEKLLAHIEANDDFILPENRRNEILSKLKEPLRWLYPPNPEPYAMNKMTFRRIPNPLPGTVSLAPFLTTLLTSIGCPTTWEMQNRAIPIHALEGLEPNCTAPSPEKTCPPIGTSPSPEPHLTGACPSPRTRISSRTRSTSCTSGSMPSQTTCRRATSPAGPTTSTGLALSTSSARTSFGFTALSGRACSCPAGSSSQRAFLLTVKPHTETLALDP